MSYQNVKSFDYTKEWMMAHFKALESTWHAKIKNVLKFQNKFIKILLNCQVEITQMCHM